MTLIKSLFALSVTYQGFYPVVGFNRMLDIGAEKVVNGFSNCMLIKRHCMSCFRKGHYPTEGLSDLLTAILAW